MASSQKPNWEIDAEFVSEIERDMFSFIPEGITYRVILKVLLFSLVIAGGFIWLFASLLGALI
jgi:hypothetical protein